LSRVLPEYSPWSSTGPRTLGPDFDRGLHSSGKTLGNCLLLYYCYPQKQLGNLSCQKPPVTL